MSKRLPPVGLLAPVPAEHLADGVAVCDRHGKVAFGSRAWETFKSFENDPGPGAPVLIYASHPVEHVGAQVTWMARYVGWVDSIGGAHPEGELYRPPSTQVGDEDRTRWWFGFWEVSHLVHLPQDRYIPIGQLRGTTGRSFAATFIPEGPLALSEIPATTTSSPDS